MTDAERNICFQSERCKYLQTCFQIKNAVPIKHNRGSRTIVALSACKQISLALFYIHVLCKFPRVEKVQKSERDLCSSSYAMLHPWIWKPDRIFPKALPVVVLNVFFKTLFL